MSPVEPQAGQFASGGSLFNCRFHQPRPPIVTCSGDPSPSLSRQARLKSVSPARFRHSQQSLPRRLKVLLKPLFQGGLAFLTGKLSESCGVCDGFRPKWSFRLVSINSRRQFPPDETKGGTFLCASRPASVRLPDTMLDRDPYAHRFVMPQGRS